MSNLAQNIAASSELPGSTLVRLVMPLVLLTFSVSAHADPLFAPKVDFGTGIEPLSVAIADLNGDERPDLAVANAFASTVSVLLGNGDGTFAAKTDFGTGSNPTSVAIADLNDDGWPDLAVASNTSNAVSILLGNGDGTFAARTDFSTDSSPLSVAIADLNVDGRPDVAVANSGFGSGASVLLGNGDGTFGTATHVVTQGVPTSIAIADLNDDGWPDLAVTIHYLSAVAVLLGNGDGTFGTAINTSTMSEPSSVAIGDLNGDGRPDLAVAAVGYYPLTVLLGHGDGTFAARTDNGFLGPQYTTYSVAIADLYADGRPDVAMTTSDEAGGSVAVLFGSMSGSFVSQVAYITGSNNPTRGMAIADLNADEKPDLVVANQNSNTVSVLLNHTPVTGVEPSGPTALAIMGVAPNPATGGRLGVKFALCDGSSARLELLDVAGRVLTSRQVGALGPGAHAIDFSGTGARRPGIYFLRLTQAGSEVRARVSVLQ